MRHLELWMRKYRERKEEIRRELKEYGHWAAGLRKSLSDIDLLREVPGKSVEQLCCYVDGGEGLYELLGLGVYFIRACAVVDSPEGYRFHRDLDLNVIEYCDHTSEHVGFLRESMELELALKAAGEGCDTIILDGSLYVKASQKTDDSVHARKMKESLKSLFEECEMKNISLVGVSEDSRSRLLVNALSLEMDFRMPSSLTDSSLLRMVGGETSFITKTIYPKTLTHLNARKPVSFPTLYLQPNPLSNPLRIDYHGPKERMDGIISLIHGLSKNSKRYGYPLPLYIAHLDSNLKNEQVEWTARQIIRNAFKSQPDIGEALLRDTRKTHRPG